MGESRNGIPAVLGARNDTSTKFERHASASTSWVMDPTFSPSPSFLHFQAISKQTMIIFKYYCLGVSFQFWFEFAIEEMYYKTIFYFGTQNYVFLINRCHIKMDVEFTSPEEKLWPGF